MAKRFIRTLPVAAFLFTCMMSTTVWAILPADGTKFFATLDLSTGGGSDSIKSIVYYDDTFTPRFSVYVHEEFDSGSGSLEEPDGLALNPVNGDAYITAFDSGTPGATSTQPDGLIDTAGDIDLFRVNFETVYTDWVNNQASAYTTYYSQSGIPGLDHTNPVFLAGAIDKIGEVGRTQGGPTFNRTLEFVSPTRLVLLDNHLGEASPGTSAGDYQIRVFDQVSASPGAATQFGTNEGGYNSSSVTESWESTIIGRINLDAGERSEQVSLAYINKNGVEGVWTGDKDIIDQDGDPMNGFQPLPVGDDIGFFQITDWTSTTGNGFREHNVGGGPVYPTLFQLDDDPVTDPNSNDGVHDRIFVNRQTGQLIIIESGFDDDNIGGEDEIAVVTREIDDYNDQSNIPAGQIDFGAWGYAQADTTGNDDFPQTLVGAHSIYDPDDHAVYFWDNDFSTGSLVDIWKLDLTSGSTTLVVQDADLITIFNAAAADWFDVITFGEADVADADFDDDSDVDADDIDILADMIFRGAADPGGNDTADLDGVGGVNQDDMDYMVNTVLETVFGDADLDDDVDGADFDAWRIRDSLGGGIGWATGDWDGDNDVDGADFDHWRLRLPAIGGGGVAAVPEPATLVLMGLAVPALGLIARRRK